MTTELDQEQRLLSIDTPLGTDVLVLQSFTGSETISSLFSYQLELLSSNEAIAPADIVSKNITVRINLADGSQRYFNGHVSQFTGGAMHTRDLRRYRAEVVPWLWFLTRAADCRIFQNKSTPQIIEQVFQDLGFSGFEMDLQGSHPEHIYRVQYRETAFDFVSRLMEEEGIFYWFRQADGSHTLVIADHKGAYTDCLENEIEFHPGSLIPDHISQWEHCYEYRSGKYAQTDYNFETSRTSLQTSTNTLIDLPEIGNYERYDYPGGYRVKGDGENLTKIRMEEDEVPHDVVRCVSGCRSLYPCGKFTLTRHECSSEQDKSYVVTSIQHSANDQTQLLAGGETYYENSFECIPDVVVFRPGQFTPKPKIRGPQTAVVVGPAGEEIYPDEYGRVKVQFHWDRVGQNDENSSCWIRVAQTWAGKRWGAMMIPRIGQEVIVDFLEGDPDRPIITGRVYNSECMPPYALPDNATMTTLKSNSSKGGGGFNEIRFEDKKGDEQLFLHAEKNQDVRVKSDTFEWIGNERHLIVKQDQLEQVEGDKHLTLIGGDSNTKIAGTVSLDAGLDLQQKVGMNHALDAGMEIHLKAGMNVVIEAGMSITLKAGGGFVVVGPAGVTISGTPVLINSGGSAGSGSGCSPDAAKPPKEAATAEPGGVAEVQASPTPPAPVPPGSFQNPQAQTHANAARDGTPFCEQCEAARRAQTQQQSD